MAITCCVCGNSWRVGDNISYHCFPKNPERKQQWAHIVNIDGDSKYQRICSKHFKDVDYTRSLVSNNLVLKSDAIPSLNLDRENNNALENTLMDHENYANNGNIVKHEVLESSKKMEAGDVEGSRIETAPETSNSSVTYCQELQAQPEETNGTEQMLQEESCFINLSDSIPETSQPIDSVQSKKLSSKRKNPLPDDVRADFGDEDFLKYKRITDVKWDNIADCPKKSKLCWEIAVETIKENKDEIKTLKAKVNALTSTVDNLRGLLKRCKEKSSFRSLDL